MDFRGRRSTKDMFMRDVRRSGRWFPERGCILEYQMCRFAKMILRDRCSTSYDLALIFRGRRSTLDRWTGKIAKRIGTSLSALHNFPFLKEVSQNSPFLMSCTSKNEDVSQNCFVSDVRERPQPPFGPSVASLCHPWVTTTNLSYRFPIFETSATALCGTTGIVQGGGPQF